MKIPVIINNRDILTWPKAMIERIKKYDNVGEIYIVDNASTNIELKVWYRSEDCKAKVVYSEFNYGHTAPWKIKGLIDFPYYVVTDSDLGLEDTPDDTLIYLLEKEKELKLGKVGLGLNWQIVRQESPYYNHMQGYELRRWLKTKVISDVAVDVPTDTTFALYSKPHYFIGGGSTFAPYVARHYPWELTDEQFDQNEEFKYYIQNASNSSSYKWFLGK